MLNNAISQVAPVEQVIVAVKIFSPVSVSAIKMSNVPMFVWNRVIRPNILQPLGFIDRAYLIISSNSNSRPRERRVGTDVLVRAKCAIGRLNRSSRLSIICVKVTMSRFLSLPIISQ